MAIAGMGTDIVEIARIEQQLQKSDRLARRILTEQEFSRFSQHNFPGRYLAKRFAAKEAAVKAAGLGIGNGVNFTDVEVCNLPSGQPYLVLHGKMQQWCEEQGISRTHLSISDEQAYAVATVILEI